MLKVSTLTLNFKPVTLNPLKNYLFFWECKNKGVALTIQKKL